MVMKGLTWSSLKTQPALIPLFIFLGLGMGGSLFYTLRLAVASPEVSWMRKSKPEPWNDYSTKQYKFYSPSLDYSKMESPAPKY